MLKDLRKSKNLTQDELAAFLEVTRQTIQRWESDESKIPKATVGFLEYEFGLRQPPAQQQTNSKSTSLDKSKPALALRSTTPGKGIPLVRPEAIAGPGNFDLSVIMEDALDFYQITDLKEADFMMRVRGDSMANTYNAGDIVACKRIESREHLAWNRIYVISTKSWGMLIKRIKKGANGAFTLLSDNPEYDPMELSVDDINDLALVIGGVRLEG